ncbi:hypothetical protein BCR36DRAFT_402809 [Piromyces finnis]|uniref:Helicase ATP-binding domain-containing protein n=1 Tax=Piromyces finnis TaxID=1754191 RepID=A0A1Y1VHV8_9FUNG|nr:hypothetical protein BCR36DRAFT_402809 [Piromyces finnis]|eukprot:ORX56051.1 hypothetical protein BCR36DRAFT_402809 [Piromyces finnis]
MLEENDNVRNDNELINQIIIAKELEKVFEYEKVLKIYENLSGKLPHSCEILIKKKIEETKSKINVIINNDGFYYEPSNSNYYLPGGFGISKSKFQKLTLYQKDGIKWIYSIYHEKKCGCILADDKELNKESQIINVIDSLYNSMKAGKFLLIVPLEKLNYWERIIKHCLQNAISIFIFNSTTKNRQEKINYINSNTGILITTYDMITYNYTTLLINWDLIICDDGCRKINNHKTKRYQALNKINTKFKILLSDNPLPNKFYDIYSIFNYLMGNIKMFGTYEEFKSKYILKHSNKTNKNKSVGVGNILNEDLQYFIQCFVLRREKDNQELYNETEESEYSDINDDETYENMKNFIIEDDEYMEDEDIDENDKKYSNIYWKEEYYNEKSNSDTDNDNDLNKELLELNIDNEKKEKDLNNRKDFFYIKPDSDQKKKKYIIEKNTSQTTDKYTFNNNDICSYCNKVIIENEDGSIRCCKCGNYEHFTCSGIPYNTNIDSKINSLRYYFCHSCRNFGLKEHFYSLNNENKMSIEYDKSLNSKLVKEDDYILKYLQTEDTYDKILNNNNNNNNNNNTKLNEKYNIMNDDDNILNITGKFGMETSIDNLSSIMKNSNDNIIYNINNDGDIINENYQNYQDYINEFKTYLEKKDKLNALNSLLNANKLNSNDLNLHWWIIKIIIDLNII